MLEATSNIPSNPTVEFIKKRPVFLETPSLSSCKIPFKIVMGNSRFEEKLDIPVTIGSGMIAT